jgi:hypothetical protein
MYFALNAWSQPLDFELPTGPAGGGPWLRVLDSARASPDDLHEPAEAPPVTGTTLSVPPRSVVVLFAAAAPVPPAGTAPPA